MAGDIAGALSERSYADAQSRWMATLSAPKDMVALSVVRTLRWLSQSEQPRATHATSLDGNDLLRFVSNRVKPRHAIRRGQPTEFCHVSSIVLFDW